MAAIHLETAGHIGAVTDGQSGFFTGLVPAIPGSTLLLDYAVP